jgi:hypothetical protein
LLSEFIETLIPCLKEELFVISKNYTVAQEMDWTYGKWPDFLGNSYFIDSQWLYLDIIDMLLDKIEAFVPEQFNAQKDDSPYD